MIKTEYKEFAHLFNAINCDLVKWRRFLHQNPEKSFEEFDTSSFIHETIEKFPGIKVSRPTKTSVMACLRGNGNQINKTNKTNIIAIRADIDALPINEENTISYCSKNEGVMHACGHDGHAAILLGVAKVLSQLREHFSGEIRFIFQHAEELPPGGGEEIVRTGILEGVQYIFAAHLWSDIPVGMIGILNGPIMAAPDNFKIIIKGKGGHAAHPEQTIDPIIIGSQIITNLQNIRSRLINALDPLVITVTQFHGGSAYNVIPDSAFLEGTIRTFDSDLREHVPLLMNKIVKGICSSYGAEYKLDFTRGYEPVINDEYVNSVIKKVAIQLYGHNYVIPFKPSMGGEDFSAYLDKIPGSLFFIGSGNKNKGIIYPIHHPKFDIDEDSLLHGVKLFVFTALELLREKENY